jgi:prevent-host-death family protein
MRSVNVAEFKNRLSTYLTYAKSGEVIVIRDRNLPVAKLIPFTAEGASEEELALVAAGAMRLPEEPLNLDDFGRCRGRLLPAMPRCKQFWVRGPKAGEGRDCLLGFERFPRPPVSIS